MTLTINREFLRRHLFVVVVFAGMGAWFGYDGFVRYPSMSATALYASIEGAQPSPEMPEAKLQAFKAQKTATQRGLCGALELAALVVALHLLAVARFRFSFDDGGFVWNGKRRVFADIRSVDRTKWEKKGILRLVLADGIVKLDAWHHAGVDAFEKLLAR